MGTDPGPTFASSPWDTQQEPAADGSRAVEVRAHALAEEEHRTVMRNMALAAAACHVLKRAHTVPKWHRLD